MSWIDAHAHLCAEEMTLPVHPLVEAAAAAGCVGIVNVATDSRSLQDALELEREFPWVSVAAAVTPHDAGESATAFLEEVEQVARAGKLVAIGETGLDYHYWERTKEAQKLACARQLEWAAELGLPVVIHCRDAFADFFALLDAHYARSGRWLPGMLHCFTGTRKEAEQLVEQGWYVSLSGIVTYPKSVDLQSIASWIPIHQLLLETDAPWLAPKSCRGSLNRPDRLLETAGVVAALRQTTVPDLLHATAQNARDLFVRARFGGTS